MLEVLRLKTPLQISLMTTTTYPTKLMGYDIPTRSTIVANYVAVHEDPKLFPDPLTFKPERFIDENGKIHIGEGFLVFGIGECVFFMVPILLLDKCMSYGCNTSVGWLRRIL